MEKSLMKLFPIMSVRFTIMRIAAKNEPLPRSPNTSENIGDTAKTIKHDYGNTVSKQTWPLPAIFLCAVQSYSRFLRTRFNGDFGIFAVTCYTSDNIDSLFT